MQIESPQNQNDEFLNTLLAFQIEGASENKLAKCFLASTRIKRITHQACYAKKIADSHMDDISQESFMLFLTKYAKTIQPVSSAYSVISSIAYNLASNRRQKSSETSIDDLAHRFSDDDEDAYAATAYLFPDAAVNHIEQLEAALDTHAAATEFGRRMQLMSTQVHAKADQVIPTILRLSTVLSPVTQEVVVEYQKAGVEAQPVSSEWTQVKQDLKAAKVRSPIALKREITEEGIRLNEIRKEMGMDNKRFASLLEITSSALVSYLYGTVQSVPKEVVKRAEKIYKSFSNDSHSSRNDPDISLFDGTMTEIVNTWIKALDLDPNDPEVNYSLAAILDVSRPTVWRWRTKDMRPRLNVLVEYDKIIANLIEQKKRLEKKNKDKTID